MNPSNLAVELGLPRVMSSYIWASAFRERGNDPLTDTDTTLLFRYECTGSASLGCLNGRRFPCFSPSLRDKASIRNFVNKTDDA